MSKETYHSKATYITLKETYKRKRKRKPISLKRDLYHLKKTYRRDLQKRPTKEPYEKHLQNRDVQKRP